MLKQNVYQNYVQFIETAKEISHLESEMYQLSQILSEQRSFLNIICSNEVTETISENNFEIKKNSFSKSSVNEDSTLQLIQLLENVEGVTVSILNKYN